MAFVFGFFVHLEFKVFRRALNCRHNGIAAVYDRAFRKNVFERFPVRLGYVVHEVDFITRNRIQRLFCNVSVLIRRNLRRKFRRDNTNRRLPLFDMTALVVPSVHSVDKSRFRILHQNQHLHH